jgi:DNA polymerase-3 subunit gamma/tau
MLAPMDETTGTPLSDEPALPGFAPPAAVAPPAASPGASPYRVLARKYRPRTFDDLIGQDAMVRTLSNAFETGRIPQAWMLTGVRGVGKTTTARILARALNYELPDDKAAGPTIRMPRLGVHCEPIMESRHVDVLEMDAASHTGIDDVRQITDGVRYAPVTARYKVYIIDEVHMLSDKAFNAFLKTLEEPPPHAKFVFATTEIRKVPVTILSRCQRFDLRRVSAEALVAHLARVCAAEGVAVEGEALAAIARAAEGSVRDSLSLLDQAIAHGAGTVTGETVRDMLGLADRAQVIDLFAAVMRGDVPASFAGLRAQYDAGADPALILSDLAAFTHLVTRLKLVSDAARDSSLSEAERVRGAEFAQKLSTGTLSRAWQILLKGIPEVQTATRPVAAAEMALVRLCYAAELPPPDAALRLLREGAPIASAGGGAERGAPARSSGPSSQGSAALAQPQTFPQAAPSPRPEPAPGPRLRRFEDAVALAGERREIALKSALERDVRLVRFEDGRIEFALVDGASRNLPNDIKRFLDEATGRRWAVALSSEPGAPTLHAQRQALERERKSDAAGHPLVQAVLSRFPGAQMAEGADAPPDPEADEEL